MKEKYPGSHGYSSDATIQWNTLILLLLINVMILSSVITFHWKAAKHSWETIGFRIWMIWVWFLGWQKRSINMANCLTSLRPHFFIHKTILAIWNHKELQVAKTIFRKKNKARGITSPDFKTYYKARVIKRVWHWPKDRPTYQCNWTESLK